jgi:hypothetical protein
MCGPEKKSTYRLRRNVIISNAVIDASLFHFLFFLHVSFFWLLFPVLISLHSVLVAVARLLLFSATSPHFYIASVLTLASLFVLYTGPGGKSFFSAGFR